MKSTLYCGVSSLIDLNMWSADGVYGEGSLQTGYTGQSSDMSNSIANLCGVICQVR